MSASNPAKPEPTEIAGRFQVVQKLGAGAFGTVYKAKDRILGRMLAIKTIRLEGLAASQTGLAEMLERFQREARTAAQLKHPNIVTIYDIGDADGVSYISMEFIDGVGLDNVISEAGRLPVERAAALGAQVADALDYAHRHGVVHRDIKPANIMIEPGDRVKVTDFGIAKPGDSAEHLTMTGSLLGTPSYMSPEQARGHKLDGRSDLFSLGCVIYEMLAGRKAFRGESITALLFKIITEEPPALRELDPNVPDAMLRLLGKALAKAPEARYQTGREFADDLLALTQPTAMPTVRAMDVPTLPGEPPPSLSIAPTVLRPQDGDASTQPARVQTLPPTVVTPPTVAAQPPASAPPLPTPPTLARPSTVSAPPARPQAAVPRAAAPRRGAGPALVLGLAAAALLGLVALGAGAWWLLKGRAPAAPVDTATAVTQPAEARETPPADAGATPSTLAPAAGISTPEAAPASSASAGSEIPEAPPVSAGADPRPPVRTATNTNTNTAVPTQVAPPAGRPAQRQAADATDYSFLDDVPAEGPDGRELGEALAQRYKAGGSGGIGNRRFAARPRVPRQLAPVERPAVATLAHLMFAEQAYHRSNGRYGSLSDLKAAGMLLLDVPIRERVFERARYRFELTTAGGEFKATATPLIAGRPFVADDNGFVLVDE